jgi:L-alanine-DL-glutamate epimerase-like enolase superfamily enzyme
MTDDAGTVGRSIGYSRGAPVSAVVERMLAPLWQGGDLGNIAGLSARTASIHSMQGTHGIFWRALSLVDCAAYDLACRAQASHSPSSLVAPSTPS